MTHLSKNHLKIDLFNNFFFSNSQVGYYDPFVNVRSLAIKNVDEWGIFHCFPLKYLNFDDSWLLQKEYNLNNFPLIFTVFRRYPTMIKEVPKTFADSYISAGMKKSGYGGIDGLVLGNLAQALEFKVVTKTPKYLETYGYKLKNGSFSGAIGDILNGDADAAMNGRFFFNYYSPEIEFLTPTYGDKVCVIAPSAEKIPQWKTIFMCFRIYVWYAYIAITIFATAVFILLKFYEYKRQRNIIRQTYLYSEFKYHVVEHQFSCKRFILTVWKVMLGYAERMPLKTVERILIGSCLLANIILSGCFEVNMLFIRKLVLK